MISGIDHVQIAAPPGCEKEARRFFGQLLGLEEIERPAPLRGRGGVWFRAGSQELHVGVDPGFAPARKAHPAFAARDYETLHRALLRHGVELLDDDSLPGVRRCYLEDPWGNRVELLSRPRDVGADA